MDTTDNWADATIAGIRALSASRHEEAARHWFRSLNALRLADASDPRRAASHTNAGAGHIFLGQWREAEAALGEAEQRWTRVLHSIESLDVPVVGISSSFHFRLASQNLTSFAEARRRRYAKLCEACLAITRFNRLLARMPCQVDALEASRRPLAASLSETLGPRAPEVRLLASDPPSDRESPTALYGEKISEFRLRQQSMSAALSDECLRLETATALTVVVTPGLRVDIHPQLPDHPHRLPRYAPGQKLD